MQRAWAAERQALATVRRFNAANGSVWFWPKIAAALTSKHHWLIIACDSCGTVVDLDLRVKPRDPELQSRGAARRALPALQRVWPPALIALSRHPSIDDEGQRLGSSPQIRRPWVFAIWQGCITICPDMIFGEGRPRII